MKVAHVVWNLWSTIEVLGWKMAIKIDVDALPNFGVIVYV